MISQNRASSGVYFLCWEADSEKYKLKSFKSTIRQNIQDFTGTHYSLKKIGETYYEEDVKNFIEC